MIVPKADRAASLGRFHSQSRARVRKMFPGMGNIHVLELLGCYGAGKVEKFAEICAATVLAGEISLASAVVAGDWVEAHDKYGRNRK